MLNELGRLRSIINRIQLEPSLANKVAELDDLQAYENPISQSATSNTGLLAPISRLLWSQSSGNSTAPAQRSLRRKPSAHPTSKLTALRAVAAETVNVEFGSGAVKQAISAPQSGPPSRDSQFRPSALDGDARSGLRNIFAGSSRQGVLRADREDGWVSLARPTAAPPGRQQKQGAPPTLSSTMDAVLDNFAQSHQQAAQAVPHPKLLERTLRPRGLSDSSIHSTFTSHANPAQVTTTRLSMTEHSLPIADDDLEATLEDSSENAEFMLPPPSSPSQVPIPRSVRPAPRTELGTSTGGGASLFGQWAQWSALDDGTGLATGSRHSHLRSLSRRDKM